MAFAIGTASGKAEHAGVPEQLVQVWPLGHPMMPHDPLMHSSMAPVPLHRRSPGAHPVAFWGLATHSPLAVQIPDCGQGAGAIQLPVVSQIWIISPAHRRWSV